MRNRIWAAGAVVVLAGAGFTLPVGVADAPSPSSVPEESEVRVSAGEAEPASATTAIEPAPIDREPAARQPEREPALAVLRGSASYYADLFEGRTTASGRPFHQAELVAAHKTLPFGTRLRVTNLANGREVEVEVVDRGPYAHGRILDLSKAAARRLDFIRRGHTRVRIEVLERGGGDA